jgi:N utilization substance protein B
VANGRHGRHGARRLLVQALYQMQLTGHSPDELAEQFREQPGYAKTDVTYFDELLALICADSSQLNERISGYGDIPAEQIDPVERAVMWVALAELQRSADVPVKVIINEAIELAKTFGAEGGYRYVNGLLDKAAADLR